jgi:hypothetical protein
MRWLVLALCLVLQLAWGDLLAVRGHAPDLLLLGVLWAAAPLPPWQAALLGFLAGLGADLAGALDPLGAGALAACSAGFWAALLLRPELRLPLPRALLRGALLLAPLELFLANLRYRGMDYSALRVSLRLALPVWLYTLALLAILLALLPARARAPRR